MPRAKPLSPEEEAAKRLRVKLVAETLQRQRERALVQSPADIGLKASAEELDSYLRTQLALLHRLVDESRDPETGEPTAKGPFEFMFSLMNDRNADMSDRLKAAKELMPYVHKRVPLVLAEDPPPDETEQEHVSAVEAVGQMLSRLVGGKHKPAALPGARQKLKA